MGIWTIGSLGRGRSLTRYSTYFKSVSILRDNSKTYRNIDVAALLALACMKSLPRQAGGSSRVQSAALAEVIFFELTPGFFALFPVRREPGRSDGEQSLLLRRHGLRLCLMGSGCMLREGVVRSLALLSVQFDTKPPPVNDQLVRHLSRWRCCGLSSRFEIVSATFTCSLAGAAASLYSTPANQQG